GERRAGRDADRAAPRPGDAGGGPDRDPGERAEGDQEPGHHRSTAARGVRARCRCTDPRDIHPDVRRGADAEQPVSPEKTWSQANRRRLSKRTIQLCGSPVEMSKLSSRFSTTGRMTTAPISAVGTIATSNRRT